MARRNDSVLIEKALQKRKNQEFAKRNLSEWYRKFTRYHNPWMRQLLDTFMIEGDFGINPLLLADRYKDVRDIEVALFASMLVTTKEVDKIISYCNKIAEIITDRPYIWLSKRSFVQLDDPKMRDTLIFPGVRYESLAVIMNKLWQLYDEFGSIEAFCKWGETPKMPAETLASQLQNIGYGQCRRNVGKFDYQCSLILARLSRKDGIGLGLWSEPVKNLYPMDSRVRSFVNTFFFKHNYLFTIDEKISLMGFKDGMELYYATLAWNDFISRKPEEAHRYEKLFMKHLARQTDSEDRKNCIDMQKALPSLY